MSLSHLLDFSKLTPELALFWLALPVFDYYMLLMAFYWYHRILHMPFMGPLYRMHHVGHHKEKFHINRLRAPEYGSNGGDGWFETGGELVFGVPLAALIFTIFYCVTLPAAVIFLAVVAFVLFSGDAFHSSYHLNDDAKSHPHSLRFHRWIVTRPYYRKFQFLHDIHHAKTGANFGFADFTMDKLFGTYSEDGPAYLERARKQHPDAAKYQ